MWIVVLDTTYVPALLLQCAAACTRHAQKRRRVEAKEETGIEVKHEERESGSLRTGLFAFFFLGYQGRFAEIGRNSVTLTITIRFAQE